MADPTTPPDPEQHQEEAEELTDEEYGGLTVEDDDAETVDPADVAGTAGPEDD